MNNNEVLKGRAENLRLMAAQARTLANSAFHVQSAQHFLRLAEQLANEADKLEELAARVTVDETG